MEDVTLSPASPADLPAVISLLDRCALPSEDLQPAHLEHFVLCRSGTQLVGTVGIEPLGELGLLRSLAVAPEVRGRQLGHRLWDRAQAEARRHGIRQLYLLTTTAERLFAKWGFRSIPREQVPEPIQKTTEYRSLCPTTATVMATTLTSRG